MIEFRAAGPGDADRVALLHADSWRRHYRHTYSAAYLDGDVVADRSAVWSARLAAPAGTHTVLAEDGGSLVGFAHVVFDQDARWGSLIDNLHVSNDLRRTGVGSALVVRAASAVVEHAANPRMYLWVLEANVAAQRFYAAIGGDVVETAPVTGQYVIEPATKLLVAWPDATVLAG
ncbi:MAG TPA: GNAT family N-acetyltransferase [Micromonosporaceae bacterium]